MCSFYKHKRTHHPQNIARNANGKLKGTNSIPTQKHYTYIQSCN